MRQPVRDRGRLSPGNVLRKQWLPEYLQSLGTLATVLAVFIASNQVMHESGLLAVTLMGMWMATMKAARMCAIFCTSRKTSAFS